MSEASTGLVHVRTLKSKCRRKNSLLKNSLGYISSYKYFRALLKRERDRKKDTRGREGERDERLELMTKQFHDHTQDSEAAEV